MELRTSPSSEQRLRPLYLRTCRRGWMSASQYRFIAKQLLAHSNSTLLVFGLGYDSPLWFRCAGGGAAYVEDDPSFLTMAPAQAQVVMYRYPTRVGQWSEVPNPPQLIARPWDYVLVDGPRGYHEQCPGRQIPIAWAKQLALHRVFVHDYERIWERQLCDKILGLPSQTIGPEGARRGELAVFNVHGGMDSRC